MEARRHGRGMRKGTLHATAAPHSPGTLQSSGAWGGSTALCLVHRGGWGLRPHSALLSDDDPLHETPEAVERKLEAATARMKVLPPSLPTCARVSWVRPLQGISDSAQRRRALCHGPGGGGRGAWGLGVQCGTMRHLPPVWGPRHSTGLVDEGGGPGGWGCNAAPCGTFPLFGDLGTARGLWMREGGLGGWWCNAQFRGHSVPRIHPAVPPVSLLSVVGCRKGPGTGRLGG